MFLDFKVQALGSSALLLRGLPKIFLDPKGR